VYVIAETVLVITTELTREGFTILAAGFIPCAVISCTGIVRSIQNKGTYKTTVSHVVNIIGAVSAVCSLLLVIPNGGFVIK
jgi:hypothetical protein